VKAFETAMKKPEFVDLLSDYMNEISDPKNREVLIIYTLYKPIEFPIISLL